MKLQKKLVITMIMLLGFAATASATYTPPQECIFNCEESELYAKVSDDHDYWFNSNNLTSTWTFNLAPPLTDGDVVMSSKLTTHFYLDIDTKEAEKASMKSEEGTTVWSDLVKYSDLDNKGHYGWSLAGDISNTGLTAELQDFMLSITVNNELLQGTRKQYTGEWHYEYYTNFFGQKKRKKVYEYEYVPYDFYGDFGIYGMDLEVCYEESAPAPVPEPGTLLLLGSGLAGLALYRRKKAAK